MNKFIKIIFFQFYIVVFAIQCSPKAPVISTRNSQSSVGVNGNNPIRNSIYSTGPQASQALAAQQQIDISTFLNLETQIKNRKPILDAEKARRDNLMLELMANIGAGCMGSMTVNTVEVIITGQKLNDNDVTALKQADQYLPQPVQGQTNFQFELGTSSQANAISFTNNEQQNPIFANGVHFTYSVPQGQGIPINTINSITVKKTAPSYTKTDFCLDSSGKTITGCSLLATILEVERYELKSLTVNVNGNPLYSNGIVNHIFNANDSKEANAKSQGLSWQDNTIQLNDAYIALLQNNNCPTSP